MVGQKSYKNLEAWKKSRELVTQIYNLTSRLPPSERFGLVNQMRRSAVSVVANIAEGFGRQYKKETIHFLHVARGSAYELETEVLIANDLDFIDSQSCGKVLERIGECIRIINGLINYVTNNRKLR